MAAPSVRKRFQNFFSRSQVRARQNLGIIFGEDRAAKQKVRNQELELYDAYYEGTQYDKLPRWDEIDLKDGEYIPVRKRQPRIKFNFAKVLVDRIASKLVGASTFPDLRIEDSEQDDEFIETVIKVSRIKSRILDAVKMYILSGSSLLRFYLDQGSIIIESYHSKYCYPVFKPNGQLQSVRIQYVYEDEQDRDAMGNPKSKWFKLELGEISDILYDNPQYQVEGDPQFQIVSKTDHNLGFVQAEWFRTGIDKHSPDGPSLIKDVLDFIDEMNYSLSQSSLAIGYGQEPQLVLSGMEQEEVDKVIKSSTKAWALGKEGKAEFLEANLMGVEKATDLRDKIRLAMQDVSRVVLLDPEKAMGKAQSGKAMEALNGPFVELINELRPEVEERLISLVQKLAIVIPQVSNQGFQTDIIIPPGYTPTSLDITAHWPAIFPIMIEDLQVKAAVAVALTQANIYSREWATEWMAKDVGIDDVVKEMQKIELQKEADMESALSPFGSSFGGMSGSKQTPGIELPAPPKPEKG